MPTAEILTIGDELLSGETVDTNANLLDKKLSSLGWTVVRHTSVADDVATIASCFTASASRAELVISSGGLGPTQDDLTLEALAAALGCSLAQDDALLASLERKFARFGRQMSPNNLRQVMVPEIGEAIDNPVGTAPVFTAPIGDAQVWLLPGVPREVRHLIDNVVGPRIARADFPSTRRTVKTVGLGESRLEHRIRDVVTANPDVRFGYRAIGAETHIKLFAVGPASAALIDAAQDGLRSMVGEAIFGFDEDKLEAVVASQLELRSETVATAESCTGGMLAKMLTDTPGASAYMLGGVVAYANGLKVGLLGVEPSALEAHGAVSEQVARQMAEGARSRLGADWGVSTTGIAGPGGGSDEKPVGTVYIGIAGPDGSEARQLSVPGDRAQIRRNTALIALDWLRRRLG